MLYVIDDGIVQEHNLAFTNGTPPILIEQLFLQPLGKGSFDILDMAVFHNVTQPLPPCFKYIIKS